MSPSEVWRNRQLRLENLGSHLRRGDPNAPAMGDFVSRTLPPDCVARELAESTRENSLKGSFEEELLKIRAQSAMYKKYALEQPINVTAPLVVYESVG